MKTGLSAAQDIPDIGSLRPDADGLIPAVVQDARTGEILMLAYMNGESLSLTHSTGYATFWSRSRNRLWMKGESSGNRLSVIRILVDCDKDSLVLRVHPSGPACHTGRRTCFHSILWEIHDPGTDSPDPRPDTRE